MSLEQTLERTNELLSQIVTILNTGVQAPAALGEPEKRTRASKSKTDAAAPAEGPAITTAPDNVLGTVEGDPAGTRYFLIAAHNTVYAQKPGDPDCTIPGAEIITAKLYLEKKAEFAKKTQAVLEQQKAAPTTTGAPAPAQESSTPAASTASSQPSEATSAEVPFSKVVERMTELSKSDKPGHGRDGVLAVLKKYLPGDDRPTVTKLQPLGLNAAILAHIETVLAPAAAEEFDPLA